MDDYIYKYSRKQALEDGVLIDVTERAKEIGYKLQTAITSNLFYEVFYDHQNNKTRETFLDIALIFIARKMITEGGDKDIIELNIWNTRTWIHIGPGDDPEPVITIMKPEDY